MNHFDELLEHLLSDREISNNTIFHGANRLNIAWNSTKHLLGFLTYG